MFALYRAAKMLHRSGDYYRSVVERDVARRIDQVVRTCRTSGRSRDEFAVKNYSRSTEMNFMCLGSRGLSRVPLRPFCFLTMIGATCDYAIARCTQRSSLFHWKREPRAGKHADRGLASSTRERFDFTAARRLITEVHSSVKVTEDFIIEKNRRRATRESVKPAVCGLRSFHSFAIFSLDRVFHDKTREFGLNN